MLLYGIAALGILGLVAALALFAFGREGSGSPESASGALAGARCTIRSFPALDRGHVETPPKNYNSFPPSSGPHSPAPAPWNAYDEQVQQFILVHNLEHGGVIVQYGSGIPDSDVEQILEWYRDDPNGIVVAPLPALKSRIALVAWTGEEEGEGNGNVAMCPRFDAGAFDAFKGAYGFKAPERFPREILTPGS